MFVQDAKEAIDLALVMTRESGACPYIVEVYGCFVVESVSVSM